MSYRILIVDDEPQIHRFLKPSLTAAGYDVMTAASGQDALKLVAQHAPDALVLDLGLPDMDGKDVISKIRAWSKVPILVLSARDRETEKIDALDLGANDYVNKPFGVGELMARLRVALRNLEETSGQTSELSVGPIVMDQAAHTVLRSGTQVRLTPKEFDLLAMLLRNRGRVITHRQLLTSVWGPAHTEDLQYLRVFIGQLRQKLEADPDKPKIIVTEPGVGYRVMPEDL